MSRIRSRNTQLELKVRQYLFKKGLRYRIHYDIVGRPDIVFPSRKIALFVHGCFWHPHSHCRLSVKPKTRKKFWESKLSENSRRDSRNIKKLRENGWKVIVIRECGLVKSEPVALSRVYKKITSTI